MLAYNSPYLNTHRKTMPFRGNTRDGTTLTDGVVQFHIDSGGAMIKRTLIAVSFLWLAGCATVEPVWKTIPEAAISYRKAWPIIVSTISDKFDIVTVDANSGYLRTDWKVKKDFLGTPESRVRMAVRTESKEPLKFNFRAEFEKWNSWTQAWTPSGNDSRIESEIQEEFSARLK
jgi:hypothetical protein